MKYFITSVTFFLTLALAANTFAFDHKKPVATGESYFDVATGHRYIKNSDATYKEYTKEGDLFRVSVSPDLRLLTTNKYIREIGRNCFMIYEKLDQRILKRQILPASSKHPKGWKAKTAMACLDRGPNEKEPVRIGLGYSNSQPSTDDIKRLAATAESYIDVFTGHRYTKNSDATYREYTKRGDLFRASVSPELPLLTTNRHIREIRQHCYLLYKKNINQKTEIMVLPSDQEHPKGWSVENMLISMVD